MTQVSRDLINRSGTGSNICLLTLIWTMLALGYGPAAMADTMECGNGILDTAEPDPPTKEVVKRRCGEPDEERNQGFEWFYQHSEFNYLLRFSQDGELLDIQRSHRSR